MEHEAVYRKMIMVNNELKIAYYQQPIAWEDPAANYAMVEKAFASVGREADIMIVPETFTTGFSDKMADMAEPPEGETLQYVRRLAKQHDALFVGTWVVKTDEGVFNRLHWVQPDGQYGFYDKAHTFRMSSEASQLSRGRRQALFEWRGWRIKPAICYDLRFPAWLRNTNPLSYDLLIFCANWPGSRREAWQTLLKARAIENESYVVGVNRCGTDGLDIPYKGDCMAVDFRGNEMSRCLTEEAQVQFATLHRDELEHFREKWSFYIDFDKIDLKKE